MKKNSPFTIILILLVAAAAVWYLYPSVMFYLKSPEQRFEMVSEDPALTKKVINLGLDLQGGVRLVLEVKVNEVAEEDRGDLLDRAYTVIENRVNALGVAEATVQKQGANRLIVELPGLKDVNAAKTIIGSTAQLEFKVVREPAELDKAIRTIEAALKGKAIDSDSAASADSVQAAQKEAQEQAEQLLAGDDAEEVKEEATETVEDIEQAAKKVTSITDYLVQVGNQIGVEEKNRVKVTKIIEREDVQAALKKAGLGASEFLWGHEIENTNNLEYRALYFLKKRAELKGDIIEDAQWEVARAGLSAGQAVVNLEMNSDGRKKFRRVTASNVNKFLAIVLDGTVYSAPQIREKIPNGRAQITGSFTNIEAKGLAVVLRAGALPAPVEIIEERTVGPSLGQDSINKAVKAFIVGFVLVVVFMIVYYGLSGVIANIALLLNLVFVLAIMASLGATLTLPGIAGLILIMGMALDANVIIFERIREELAMGKTIRSAVDSGYSRAFVTIMDANITTLFTAAILMWVGTGPIKGFAVTLIIGIIVSLFTALYLTRVIFNFITASKNLKKLSI